MSTNAPQPDPAAPTQAWTRLWDWLLDDELPEPDEAAIVPPNLRIKDDDA